MANITPPFTRSTAQAKLKFAQSMWNTQDPARVVRGYSPDCVWRNRDRFIKGSDEIIAFLSQKWQKEKDYVLRKELFCFNDNKIAVQFWYEYRDAHDGMKWKRCYGLEDWTYGEDGKMVKRMMSGNDVVLGKEGDGEEWRKEGEEGELVDGKEGRWFRGGLEEVESEEVTAKITERHY